MTTALEYGTCPVCKQSQIVLMVDGTLARHNVPGTWDEVPTRAGPDQETIDLARALGARDIRVPTKYLGGGQRPIFS